MQVDVCVVDMAQICIAQGGEFTGGEMGRRGLSLCGEGLHVLFWGVTGFGGVVSTKEEVVEGEDGLGGVVMMGWDKIEDE
jgi:hypothetical protein